MKYNPFIMFKKFTYDWQIEAPPKPPIKEKPVINEDYLKHYIDIAAEKVAKRCKKDVAKVWKILTIINILAGLTVAILTVINILKG